MTLNLEISTVNSEYLMRIFPRAETLIQWVATHEKNCEKVVPRIKRLSRRKQKYTAQKMEVSSFVQWYLFW